MTLSYINPVEIASADEVRARQNSGLRRQMAYLRLHSPFVAEKLASVGASFEDIRTVEDLAALPLTTKQDLRESQVAHPPYGRHLATDPRRIVRVHASSGTTGEPSFIPVTARDSALWREAVRRVYWCQGVRPTSVLAMGFSIGFFVGGIPLAQGIEDIGATFLPIGAQESDRLLDSIVRMRADVLTCTPSYALHLAETAEARIGRPAADLGIRKLVLGAEPGGGIPEVRRQLEDVWQARVTEAVGNADVCPVYGAESEMQDGCHFLVPDMLVMEIINPDTGAVLSPGSEEFEGEMVFTHINREAAPLLRFRSHDRVIVKNSPCPGGRTGPRVRIIGRSDDLLIVRGVNVWPSAIKDVVTGFRPHTTGAMRIVLTRPGPAADPPLYLQIEYGEGASDLPELAFRIETALREKLIVRTRVELLPPGALPRSSMKSRLVEYNEAASAVPESRG